MRYPNHAILGTSLLASVLMSIDSSISGQPVPDGEQNTPSTDPIPDQTPEQEKTPGDEKKSRKRGGKTKAKGKTKTKAKAEPKPKVPVYDLAKTKKLLTEAGVEFNARSGIAKLVALAAEKEVDISSAEQTNGNSIVPIKYKKLYGKRGNNGDELAAAFDALKDEKTHKISLDTLQKVARQNKVDMSGWDGLNLGQIRMNLGNVLRVKKKNGEAVAVGEKKWKAAA